MKRLIVLFLAVTVLLFSFSVFALASGDIEIQNGEEAGNGVFSYEYDDGVFGNDEVEEIFGEDAPAILALGTVVGFAALSFIPAVIVMIVFIVLNNKTVKRIREYEMTYGVVYTKDVLRDMQNIPPQNYNYNPSTFVPQYPVSNNQQSANPVNTQASSFNSTLYNEVKNENENNGGSIQWELKKYFH